ncbi:MAG: MotA/TolQ/ExbB proton channel family protein [Elusimicrobiota bacterium]
MIDILTIVGLTLGFGTVYIVMVWGNVAHLLWHKDAFLLVFGGTIASMLIGTPWHVFKNMPRAFVKVLFPSGEFKPKQLIALIVNLSERAKRDGVDSLQEVLPTIKDKFLVDGITQVIDGLDPNLIRENLEKEIIFIRKRHYQVSSVFRSMGTYAPIFGLLATLLGVVQVLRNISDPKSLGASMAIAVTGTFYGIASANFIFLPISGKLDAHTEAELLIKEVMIEGILSIQAGDIPLIVSRKLQGFMAYRLREKHGAGK